MKLSEDEVRYVAELARMSLTSEEIEKFAQELSSILGSFDMLTEVNTDDVPPTTHPLSLQNIFREDIGEPSFTLADVVANAPKVEGGFFKVKPVL